MMRRSLLGALALALSTAAAADPAAGPRRPPPPPAPTCETTVPRLAERTAKFDAFTRKSFDDALARAKLRLAPMKPRMMSPDDPKLQGVRPGKTFPLDGATALLYTTVQGYGTPSYEFVIDERDVIHPLIRSEHPIVNETHLMCGCGPMGGGAVPPRFAVVYVLPPGTTFDAAATTIKYDAKHVSLNYDRMVNGERCQPPP